jgi:tryptophanyl-tRNA synthetase
VIPVGRDQLPHVELTRTIARRFNERYGGGRRYFPEPDALLSETPLLLGLDGRKMGKSHGNSIPLAGDADDTARLIRRAKTDSERRIAYEPERRPEVANLLRIVELCTKRPAEEIAAEIGDGGAKALKEVVAEALNDHLRPIRLRRSELLRDRGQLRSLLRDGSRRANEIAEQTLAAVHDLMHTSY